MQKETEAAILQVLREHVLVPGELLYRETMNGKVDVPKIDANRDFMISFRKHAPHMNQLRLTSLLVTLASEREATWHLSEEARGWAAATAKRIRAMLRDIAQNLLKYVHTKPPSWLAPFAQEGDVYRKPAADATAAAEHYIFAWATR